MTLPTQEMQLILFAAFLFTYDSSHLLQTNEAVLTRANGSWDFFFPINGFTVRGKALYISNPLLLHREEFFLAYQFADLDLLEKPDFANQQYSKTSLCILAFASQFLIFIILPYLLFFFKTDINLLICTALIYSTAIIAGISVILKRDEIGLTKKQAYEMALEFIFCPPFTANVIRKISRSHKIKANLIPASICLLTAERWQLLSILLLDKLEEQIEINEDDANLCEDLSKLKPIFKRSNIDVKH